MANLLFMVVLPALSVYFLLCERKQYQEDTQNYFTKVWNYLDFIPPVLLLAFLALGAVGTFDTSEGTRRNQTLEATMKATISLLLWLKFLYFLRIFKSTSYFITILLYVCNEIKMFLLILFITIMAFGEALRAVS